ncbi:RNA polymerase sigma factor [Sulfurifustis variabilis]|uniref:RNA polymerase sigma factor n=1 Tax=Sulfurifustis variabilis TaxID=1675686 RepID=UPI0018D54683|nr:RNA polymerase sigma factor [Sulfurifustis variabilis]
MSVLPAPAVEGASTGQTLGQFLASVEHRAYRFALYELWDREAALDAVQDSMLRLTERYADRPSAEWPAIFFTILRNRATDAKRWRAWRRVRGLLRGDRYGEEDDPLASIPSPVDGPDAGAEARQQRERIEEALRALPARQRQVFLLREWQGLTAVETAQVLGCSVGAVKQHHFRALKALRAKLSEVWHGETR